MYRLCGLVSTRSGTDPGDPLQHSLRLASWSDVEAIENPAIEEADNPLTAAGDDGVRLSADYEPKAIYVTENGAAYPDVRSHDRRIQDTERQAYLDAYIGAVGRALEAGVPLKGYFVWSLLDNFEWAWGYWKRFGLVFVDSPTLERIPKGASTGTGR
jgi:hypothetical protein